MLNRLHMLKVNVGSIDSVGPESIKDDGKVNMYTY